jgi:sortase A
MTTRRVVRVAQVILIAAGILALGYCAFNWVGAKLFQAESARRFAAALRARNVPPIPPPRAVVPAPRATPVEGELVGRLEIPRLGLSAMVVEGVSSGDLRRAAGHVPGTAFPWQPGNVAVAGHRDTFFRCLRSIQLDDVVTLTTLAGEYHYRVVSTEVVTPADVHVLAPTGQDTLTLVTCFPFYFVGAAPRRFIVHAKRA